MDASLQALVLIEVDRADMGIARAVFLMIGDHVRVQSEQRGARGKPQHRIRISLDDFQHHFRRFCRQLLVIFGDDNFHILFLEKSDSPSFILYICSKQNFPPRTDNSAFSLMSCEDAPTKIS